MHSDHVIVFAKPPLLGKVKTRLIPELGPESALNAHCEMVDLTLKKVAQLDCSSSLWLSEKSQEGASWGQKYSLPVEVQRSGDLGIKMLDAISKTLAASPAKVVLIGSDCPILSQEDIRDAFLWLDQNDVVILPCEDGGYGLIGMKQRHAEVFSRISWGTPKVTRETLDRARNSNLSVKCGREIWDVDDIEGWRRYQALKALTAD